MDIEKEIQDLKERNKRVERDKAWEVSFLRRLFVAIATYLVASLWLSMINEGDFWLKAIVPTAAYILSTLSLTLLKKIWMRS